ncbi:exo-alpha-sialidase, partial [Candidatus Sumerlaeota bacterium]|nr:exo-alpha-sialidase [Candidatus Sumerlaeota bacterium]
RALMRTQRMGKIATALSRDGGKTWSAIKLTGIQHPGAGIDSVRLKDGRCLLVYNDSRNRRSPLSIAISYDNAETWRKWMDIEALEKGDPSELSYPNIIQAADGSVHVVYTWKRERIKHAQISLADLPASLDGTESLDGVASELLRTPTSH